MKVYFANHSICRIFFLLYLLIVLAFLPTDTWAKGKNRNTKTIGVETSVIEFYVSSHGNDNNIGTREQPFASIGPAGNEVRNAIRNGLCQNIGVIIRGGLYKLETPLLIFEPLDSGSHEYSITYRAASGETPILFGGTKITNWKKKRDNIWITDLPEVRKGDWYFRQLFVNDTRAIRACFPNKNDDNLLISEVDDLMFGQAIDRQKLTVDKDFPGGNLAGKKAELVVFHVWSISRARIMSSNERGLITYPVGWIGHGGASVTRGRSLFLEHALEFLDQPNEWYLDRDPGVLYYMAADGKTPNDIDIIAPVVERLLYLKGTKEQPIQNLHFEGLRLEHAAWRIGHV